MLIKKCFSFLSFSAFIVSLSHCFMSFAASSNAPTKNNIISLAQITKDITYLASDELKGRGNFSSELSQAANYIAERFKESGLIGANNIGAQGFLQTYKISKVTSEKLTLVLNDQTVNSENLTIVSTVNNISWQLSKETKNSAFSLHSINKNDDMQAILNVLNQQGGNHLVLLNPKHKKLFKRYQHYFQQGTTTLYQKKTHPAESGTIIIALTDISVDKLKNMQATATNTTTTTELNNVVAMLPGATKPNEIVLYSAHYDHLGTKNTEGDNIFNGADDDASGTTAIINIAQYYAKQGKNARTLMFAAFSAEEIGGFGSQYFSKQLNPKQITAMINIEMIGKPSKFGIGTLWMTGMQHSNLGKQLNQVLANSGRKIHNDPNPEYGLFYRSDNASLAKLGVPAHSFSSAQLDQDKHYHHVSDEISSLNLSSMHQVIQALTIATQPLVNGLITPSRIDTEKVNEKGLIF